MVFRRVLVVALVIVAMGGVRTAGAVTAPVELVVPQGTAFGVLGHSCGGIQEQVFATGFDATSGYPVGDAYLSTRCGGSGRGGGYHTTTYSAWVTATWDFTATLVSSSALSSAPTVDPTFVAFDASGNEIYNQSNSAFLVLGPTFVPAPRVTGVSVTAGPASGGTTVTITGTGLSAATAVAFGATPAAGYTVNGDTSITALSPSAAAGTVDVTVASAGGTSPTTSSDQFTFVASPVVSGLSPNSGPVDGGTAVTITGSGLAGANVVSFGDQAAGFVVNDDTSITAYAPVGEAVDTVAVTVTTIGGTSATSAADQYAYTAVFNPLAPTVTKVAPNSGPPAGGTAVTITGTNFTGATDVAFGATSVASFQIASPTSIKTIAPAGTDTVDVTVTSADGTSPTNPADQFSYGPRITKISPTAGSAGGNTKVSISGHNFTGVTDVMFGPDPAVQFSVNSTGTLITAKTPPEPGPGPQSVDVTVTGPDGTSPIVPTDVFNYVAPTITKLLPIIGPAGGNTKVTISGHYFVGTTDVTFGGVPAAHFTVNTTGTTITAITPPEAGSGVQPVDVSVTTSAGTGTLTAGFTYAAPAITQISPTTGPTNGGTTVTITGTNLYGTTEVDFGTNPATITHMTNTSLTVTSPPGIGTVDITATDQAGTSPTTSLDQFTY